jgi:hypothetical protein
MKLHTEQLQDRHCYPHIFRLIISEAIKWAGHVACMELSAGLWGHVASMELSAGLWGHVASMELSVGLWGHVACMELSVGLW